MGLGLWCIVYVSRGNQGKKACGWVGVCGGGERERERETGTPPLVDRHKIDRKDNDTLSTKIYSFHVKIPTVEGIKKYRSLIRGEPD